MNSEQLIIFAIKEKQQHQQAIYNKIIRHYSLAARIQSQPTSSQPTNYVEYNQQVNGYNTKIDAF
ncbi:hypothetical protein ACJJIW_20395 [Microbulbifer sp. JMSA004]|uniref:hypothetical protein n=1 Tax=unclassified Microbulbifer TaxID=2619833 RepID=UPI0024AE2D0E|nr:hypothetical protein [Microbulbifer sp. VAAF005]WHI46510.1 hypothetical protein P0078_22845 [Microbulbifer sp. VAAF005]